ncbi:unnamed protein product, partial [Mesorhabditis belari]|uniref:Uncharacterized protein n=1 Tax=Mesorhabditis belari TaxID=2138241 RepID=A0AAF3FCF3_9BILA
MLIAFRYSIQIMGFETKKNFSFILDLCAVTILARKKITASMENLGLGHCSCCSVDHLSFLAKTDEMLCRAAFSIEKFNRTAVNKLGNHGNTIIFDLAVQKEKIIFIHNRLFTGKGQEPRANSETRLTKLFDMFILKTPKTSQTTISNESRSNRANNNNCNLVQSNRQKMPNSLTQTCAIQSSYTLHPSTVQKTFSQTQRSPKETNAKEKLHFCLPSCPCSSRPCGCNNVCRCGASVAESSVTADWATCVQTDSHLHLKRSFKKTDTDEETDTLCASAFKTADSETTTTVFTQFARI